MQVAHRFRAAALLGLLTLAVPAGVGAQSKGYGITAMDVVLAVQPDGGYRISERIGYDFRGSPFTYATRDIPQRDIAEFVLDSVSAAGRRLSGVRQRRQNGAEHIRWGFPPTRGPAAFTIAYRVRGALYERGGRNIVDWDAVGRRWTVPISNLRVTVLLPASFAPVADSIRAPLGAVSRTADGWRVDYRYALLPRRTAYRVIVQVPRVLAGRPWSGNNPAGVPVPRPPLPSNYRWLLPLLAVGGLFPGLWLFASWRGPRREAMTTGAPPTSLTRAAAILPEMAGGPTRVFAAVLLDLAARGHLELRRTTTGRGIFKQKRVEAVRRDVPADGLAPFEERLLEEVGRYGSLAEFGRKGRRFRRDELKALRREAIREGLLEDHTARSASLLITAMLLETGGVVLIILSAVRSGGLELLPWGVGLASLSAGLLVPALLYRNPTDAGALLRAQVQAYLGSLRREIEQLVRVSPVEGARAYIQHLPWLTLDSRVTAYWVQKLASALKKADGELPTPGWAIDTTSGRAGGSPAYVAFMPYFHVTAAAAGAVSPGAGAAGAAGAGAGGGAGGGGGGAG